MRRAGRQRETTESRSGNSQGDPVTTHTHTHIQCANAHTHARTYKEASNNAGPAGRWRCYLQKSYVVKFVPDTLNDVLEIQ